MMNAIKLNEKLILKFVFDCSIFYINIIRAYLKKTHFFFIYNKIEVNRLFKNLK